MSKQHFYIFFLVVVCFKRGIGLNINVGESVSPDSSDCRSSWSEQHHYWDSISLNNMNPGENRICVGFVNSGGVGRPPLLFPHRILLGNWKRFTSGLSGTTLFIACC